jgi:foldase protein PrsA
VVAHLRWVSMRAMNLPGRKGLSLVLMCVIACCAGGCGSGRSSTHAVGASPDPQPAQAGTREASSEVSLPSGSVARVGSYLISGSALDHWLQERMRTLPPAKRLLPPNFADCVAQLKEEPVTPEGSQGNPAQLRQECRARYEVARREGLEQAIAAVWTLEAAREMGVAGAPAKPLGQLLSAERIDSGLLAAATSAADAVRSAITDRVRAVSAADVARYYMQHREKYATVPQLRDVQLARTQTQARGNLVREELEGGKTFAQVVKEHGVAEADFSSNGLVLELRPTEYGEPNLNHAIFGAQPDELLGPIQTVYGFFVFEVKKIHPGHFKPLSEVAGSVRQELSRRREQQAIARFVAAWHAKWIARTSCAGGFVVRGCNGFDAAASSELPSRVYSFE